MSMRDRFVESLEGRRMMDGGTIQGFVHNDVNGSGIIDEGALVPQTVLYIDANGNGRRDSGELSTKTDANGTYRFTNLPAGEFHVRVDPPEGWVPTTGETEAGAIVIFAGGSPTESLKPMMIRYRASPWSAVGQNGQHDGISPFRGAAFTQFQEVTQEPAAGAQVDPDAGSKFGTPLFTKYNTALVSILTTAGKFGVRAFSRAGGVLLWTFESDFLPPPQTPRDSQGRFHAEGLAAVFQPALDSLGRLYVPGAGGTVHMIGAPDRFGSGGKIGSKRLVFYGKENYLQANNKPGEKAQKYHRSLFINTGLTVDNAGNVYFGVARAQGKFNPLTINSGLAKVNASGRGAHTEATVLTGCTPALSADQAYAYVATQEKVEDVSTARLERFATGGLTRAGAVVLKDPSQPDRRTIKLTEGAYTMPTVAPDGDVYYVIPGTRRAQTGLGNGWLLRFSGDLKRQKLSSVAAEQQTVSIVPAGMVKGYRGRSSYLIAGTFNRDVGGRLAILDPDRAGKTRASGVNVMRVLKYIDAQSSQRIFGAWISRPVAVDPSSGSIFAVDSLTRLVRWNVSDVNDVGNSVTLGNANDGYPPATSVVIGPDGQVYTTVQFKLFTAF